jgi:hypothetical protein
MYMKIGMYNKGGSNFKGLMEKYFCEIVEWSMDCVHYSGCVLIVHFYEHGNE